MKAKVRSYIEQQVPEFHRKRLESLEQLKLDRILLRKNPYLFKTKNVNTAPDLVRNILDAYLSSQEETIFGALLENVAIYACGLARKGFKSGIEGIDLEFMLDGLRYIVSVKSGPNWGNSSQVKKMKDNFRNAIRVLRQNGTIKHIQAINGCCYGRDNKPEKGDYQKLCGEAFWTLITGDAKFFVDLIEPLGFEAKLRNETFQDEYGKAFTRFTLQFIERYCQADGAIDWDKIIRLNSAIQKPQHA